MINRKLFTAFVILSLAATPLVRAHTGASGVVKDRMERMSDIAAQMKLVSRMVSGKTEMDLTSIAVAMGKIATHAEAMVDLFPKGSGKPPSEAAPAIWTSNARFVALFVELNTAASKTASAASAGQQSQIATGFKAVAKTCKACHGKFRVELN